MAHTYHRRNFRDKESAQKEYDKLTEHGTRLAWGERYVNTPAKDLVLKWTDTGGDVWYVTWEEYT